jgi:acyl-CoA thioester hydrolase
MPLSHPTLSGFPIVVSMPVHWGEMDAYGHVNNTVFFRYFETARIAFLDRCGMLASYDRGGIGAILHSTECRFRLPLFYPDDVLVGACTVDVADDRFTMGYRIVSRAQNGVAADGSAVIVAYDYRAGRKTALPPAIRAGVMALRWDGQGRTETDGDGQSPSARRR